MTSSLRQTKRTFPHMQESKYFTKKAKVSAIKPENEKSYQRLTDAFFNKDCTDLAQSLLGQILVRKSKEGRIACKIVEVESYMAKDDKASHSYNYKQTERNKAMFMKPGTVYVYMTYGMYYCMNISSQGLGDAVLLRAVEPLEGIEIMKKRRIEKQKCAKPLLEKNISNGPSKLCQALGICKDMNQVDLVKSDQMWLEKGEAVSESMIVQCKRIGLSKKSEIWADKPLRFYILGNHYVSVRNKTAEAEYQKK